MRRDIAFDAEGVTLRGVLRLPEGDAPHPLVVMSHGFSAVIGHGLARFADVFAAAGLASLAFDHRGFGASDGLPRQEADPVAQQRDTRDAITFAATLPEVDATRIGLWGTSYSGGHALVVAATDRRVAPSLRCSASRLRMIASRDPPLRPPSTTPTR